MRNDDHLAMLRKIEAATTESLRLADGDGESMIAIKLSDAVLCIQERIESLNATASDYGTRRSAPFV